MRPVLPGSTSLLVGHCAAVSTWQVLLLSSLFPQLGFDLDREVYPLVVHAVVDEGDGMGAFCLLWLRTCLCAHGPAAPRRGSSMPSLGIRPFLRPFTLTPAFPGLLGLGVLSCPFLQQPRLQGLGEGR